MDASADVSNAAASSQAEANLTAEGERMARTVTKLTYYYVSSKPQGVDGELWLRLTTRDWEDARQAACVLAQAGEWTVINRGADRTGGKSVRVWDSKVDDYGRCQVTFVVNGKNVQCDRIAGHCSAECRSDEVSHHARF